MTPRKRSAKTGVIKVKLRIRNKQTGKVFTRKMAAQEYLSAVEEFKRKAKRAGRDPDHFEVLGEVLE